MYFYLSRLLTFASLTLAPISPLSVICFFTAKEEDISFYNMLREIIAIFILSCMLHLLKREGFAGIYILRHVTLGRTQCLSVCAQCSSFVVYLHLSSCQSLHVMPRTAASDLGLHCLPMSREKDAMLIWVKTAYLTHCGPETPKRVPWQTGKTQMKCRIMWHFTRVSTVWEDKTDLQRKTFIFGNYNLWPLHI